MRDLLYRLGRNFDGGPLVLGFTVALGLALLAVLVPSTVVLSPILLIVLLLSLLTAIFFFTRVDYALMVFFGLRAIVDMFWWVPVEVATMNVMELFSGAVAGLAAIMFVFLIRHFDDHPVLPAFYVYLLMMAIGALRSGDIRETAEILARYLSVFLLMFLVTDFFDSRLRRMQMFVLVSAVSLVPISISVYHLAMGHVNYYLDGYYRLIGGYKNLHNHALMMMFFSLLWGFWVYNLKPWWKKIPPAIVLTGSGLALAYTYVRTAWLGFAIAAVLYFFMERNWKLLLFLLGVGIFLAATSHTVQDRFKDIVELLTPDPLDVDRHRIGSGRWGIWHAAWRVYLSQPMANILLGMGIGAHKEVTLMVTHLYRRTRMDPHCDYLSLLVQVGPIALAAYLVAEWQVFVYALRVRRLTDNHWVRSFANFMVALSALQVFANTVSNAFIIRTTINWYFWCFAGLLFAEYNELTAKEAEAHPPTLAPPPRKSLLDRLRPSRL